MYSLTVYLCGISIHALREEGDRKNYGGLTMDNQFLSTPSARRATRRPDVAVDLRPVFLSTPSARRATKSSKMCLTASNFYPRPPRGGRRQCAARSSGRLDISIHALREEGDQPFPAFAGFDVQISIHALREEGDLPTDTVPSALKNFYPRPPRGGRPSYIYLLGLFSQFLSTPSARRATRNPGGKEPGI